MKISIIANPVSGNGSAYRAIKEYAENWRHSDWEIEILTTRDPNHAGLLAQELLERPPDLLAVCGGDGTINEVVSCIPDPPFPVAVLPAGTANVVARELGLPLNPIRALQIALKRSVRRVDLGKLDPGSRRCFLFCAGIGFDAYVVSKVRLGLKAKLGMAAYAIAGLHCLKSYPFPEFQITAGNRSFAATSCIVANARSYGGGLLLTPDADINDGQLDILVLQGRRRLEFALFFIKAWLRIPETHDWIHRFKVPSVEIEGPKSLLVQTDGELAGGLPLEINVAHSVFPIVSP